MAKKDDTFSKELLATFVAEADEHLKAITSGLLELEKLPAADARVQEIIEITFREVHSLKGASRAVNRKDIEAVCRPLESLFAALKRNEMTLSAELIDSFIHAVNGIEFILSSSDEKNKQSRVESLVQRLDETLSGTHQGELKTYNEPPVTTSESHVTASGTIRISTSRLDSLFRQVEEMIVAKMAAKQRVTDLLDIADIFTSKKKTSKKIRSRLLSLAPVLERQDPALALSSGINTVNTNKWFEELDDADVETNSLADRLDLLIANARSDHRVLVKMVDNLLEEIKKLLMMPLSSLFEVLPKTARDLAHDQGKDIELVINGDSIEIDRRIQEQIKDPLIHLIRNCVDHGIEKPDERIRKNKPARGKITINVSQVDTGKAEIIITDDGAGIDHTKVLSVAQKSGVISIDDSAQLSEQKIADLAFYSGVSTSSVVTDISGRGLGLAIVREKIENLGGTILLESQTGAGTTFRITLPITLSAFRGVVIRVVDQIFVLPIMNVERVVRVKKEAIKTLENRETIQLNGYSLSLVRMADILGLQRKPVKEKSDGFEQVVVLTSGEEHIAFIVDKIIHEQEILLKGLGKQLVRIRNISGSTTLGTGDLVPLLNVSDLMKSSIDANFLPSKEIVEPSLQTKEAKSILVVEDSITARSLLKNILEASGFQVKTAVDGVDALTTLKTEPFDLVVSDVEMPRMDGFDLTTKIRADKKLSELPVVLVTALDSREHRERGIDAGADAYLVKSSFDETGLLEIIGRLI